MKTKTLPTTGSMNRSSRHCGTVAALLITLVLACFALSPTARAVDPPPDGGYPNRNTAEGEDALLSLNSTAPDNTAVGYHALYSTTTSGANVAVGSEALSSNVTGGKNIALGNLALGNNTAGGGNIAAGFVALGSNTTGAENIAIGSAALGDNTTGSYNIAIGSVPFQYNVDSSFNIALGTNTLNAHTSGEDNVAIGHFAMDSDNNGQNNTAVGDSALHANLSGINNTAIGNSALYGNSTGDNNIGIGIFAGRNLTTGSNNIDIANFGVAGESKTIRIGTRATHRATYIAGISGATVPGGVGVVIDQNGHLGTVTSAARYKEQIKPMDKASEAILALKPVTFRYKHELDPDGIPQFGLVAEQVEKVNPDLVARDEQGKPYTVRYEAVNAMLLNEFLKEHGKVEEQARINQQQEATIAQQKIDFEKAIAQQEKEIQSLTARLKAQASQILKVSAQLEASKSVPRRITNNQ